MQINAIATLKPAQTMLQCRGCGVMYVHLMFPFQSAYFGRDLFGCWNVESIASVTWACAKQPGKRTCMINVMQRQCRIVLATALIC